jgi:hypothetical protein
MKHLTPDEFVDALDGVLAPERVAHLDTCAACRDEAAALEAVLVDAEAAEVPEPTPAEWAGLSARISAAVDAEPAPGWGWLAWVRAPVLVPVAGVAALVLALVVAVDHVAPRAGHVAVDVPFEQYEEWPAMAGILATVDPGDWDAMREIGLDVRPGWSDWLIADLSGEEWAELQRLVEIEGGVP